MRVLGRVRLSRITEESTSVERQREAIGQWAKMHGHDVVGWAEDTDVSGSVSPFEAPALGPWLREDRLGEWDVLCAYRLDRIARRVVPLNALFGFAQEHGKSIASVSEQIDLSNWVGRLVANVIAGVAEGELEAISERSRASQKKLRETGRWHGGNAVPYGYRAAQRGSGWYLEPDPEAARVIRWMVQRVIEGHSLRSVTKELDGVPSPKGGQWSTPTVSKILKSPAILGQVVHNGKAVVDDEGMPMQRTEALVSYTEWKSVQAKLGGNQTSGRRESNGLLLNVAYCSMCSEPLYHQATPKRDGGMYHYWRCSGRAQKMNGCTAASVPAGRLEALVEDQLLNEIGDLKRKKREYVPADAGQEDLDQVEAAIATVRQEKDLGLYEGDEQSYFDRLKKLVERRKALSATEKRESGWTMRELGDTYREAWEAAEPRERRRILIDAGIEVKAKKTDKIFMTVYVPPEIRETFGGERESVPALSDLM